MSNSVSPTDIERISNLDILPEHNTRSKQLNLDPVSGQPSVQSTDPMNYSHNSNNVSRQNGSDVLTDEIPLAETPLILACKNGQLSVVRYLVEKRKVNINQRGGIQIFNENWVIKGTPLHAAVLAGEVDIVRYLTDNSQTNIDAQNYTEYEITTPKHKFKARPNQNGSTALHLAVRSLIRIKKLDGIICCLLERGANRTLENNAGKQYWELIKDTYVKKLLLEYVADLRIIRARESTYNVREPMYSVTLSTARSLDKQASEVILNQDFQLMGRLSRINELERIGAAYILKNEPKKGLECWKKAMELRFEVNDEPSIPKPETTLPIVARIAFGDVREVQTKKELENLSSKHCASLDVQALLVYVRLFGLKNDETLLGLQLYARKLWKSNDGRRPRRAWSFDDHERTFLRCSNLILTICDPNKESHIRIFGEILECSFMITVCKSFMFSDAMQILEQMLSLLQKTSDDSFISIGGILLYIIWFTFRIMDKRLTVQQNEEFKDLLRRAVDMKKRESEGNDLLLLACSIVLEMYKHHQCCSPISLDQTLVEKVFSVLLESGADPNSKNNDNEAVIHILARSEVFSPVIRLFYEAGTHLDQVNVKGETMVDLLREFKIPLDLTGIPNDVIQLPSLQRLSARILNRCNTLSFAKLPRRLENFVKYH